MGIIRCGTLVAVASLLGPAGARAQQQEPATSQPRSFGFLFGSSRDVTPGPQRLGLWVTTLGAYDNNVLKATGGGAGGGRDPRLHISGTYAAVNASARYERTGDVIQLGVLASTAARYYPELEGIVAVSHSAGADLRIPLGRRLLTRFAPRAGYSPFFSVRHVSVPTEESANGVAAVVESDDLNLAVSERPGYTVGADGGLTWMVGPKRSSVNVLYGFTLRRYVDEKREYQTRSAGATYRWEVSRRAAVRLGYIHGKTMSSGAGRDVQTKTLELGVDYSRPLSHTRGTTIAFGTGAVALDHVERNSYRAVGYARLNHRLGRTSPWTLATEYRRGATLVEGFEEPFFADTFNLTIVGLVSRRVDLFAGGGYSRGDVGLNPLAPRYDWYHGSGRIRLALTRSLAVDTEYIYYHNRFDETASLPPQFPRVFNRQGIRLGLTAWIPLVR